MIELKEKLVDADSKIVVFCPKCGNGETIYLISFNRIKGGFEAVWCENCELPFVVELETELTCEVKIYPCFEPKEDGAD